VAKILQVSTTKISGIVEHGIVNPLYIPGRNGLNLWGPEEIFRAFLSLRLVNEFEAKYGRKHAGFKYDQVRSEMLSIRRLKSQEFLESDQWAEVTVRAAERGLNLLNL
jgi:hypothetical protein